MAAGHGTPVIHRQLRTPAFAGFSDELSVVDVVAVLIVSVRTQMRWQRNCQPPPSSP
jgi:hypothetical protein